MKKTMLDILACPLDKHHPLELHEFETQAGEIVSGMLTCPACSRFFPIIEAIPIMLPDELRDKGQEGDFIARYKSRIPARILDNPRPWEPGRI